jgi:hypothetical protein
MAMRVADTKMPGEVLAIATLGISHGYWDGEDYWFLVVKLWLTRDWRVNVATLEEGQL